MDLTRECVVCQKPAEVYCHNDDAYLCTACDAHVHGANSLAAQHHRVPVDARSSRAPASAPPVAGREEPQSVDVAAEVRGPGQQLIWDESEFYTVPDSFPVCPDVPTSSGKDLFADVDFEYLFDVDADASWLGKLDGGNDLIGPGLLDDEPLAKVPAEVPAHVPAAIPPPLPPSPSDEQSSFDDLSSTESPIQTLSASDAQPLSDSSVPTLSQVPAPLAGPTGAALPVPACSPYYPVDSALDVDSYIPRSLLPMDPLVREQVLKERRIKVQRFREKKKNRQFHKTIRYASRKAYAEVRPRIKGRFARKDEVAAMRAAGLLPVQ